MNFSIPHYHQEFILDENEGNNGFDYEKRSEVHPQPHLRVASVREFPTAVEALDNLAISVEPAFEIEIDGLIKSFPGLKNFPVFPNPENPGRPIIIMDNHNHAFYFWHWGRLKLKLPTPLTLIHIDQHKDSRLPVEMFPEEKAADLEQIFEYANHILNVGNFIPPAIKTGLIGKIILVDSSNSLNAFPPVKPPFILDIDLDFFAPEFNYIDKTNKLALIKKLLPSADLVTIATSPYFIDQRLACQIIREIFNPASIPLAE